MSRVHLIVEGQTEETFIKTLLAPYLGKFGVYVDARCVETGRKGAMRFRGGMTSYVKAKNDIKTWMLEDSAARISTMFDLYRLPKDFPGYDESKKFLAHERVKFLQQKLQEDIGNERFIPYIQLHEFESLLFSDPPSIQGLVPGRNNLIEMNRILTEFQNNPELINNNPETAPSKRLEKLFPRYDKVAYGARVIEKAGIETVLNRCTHFRSWILSLKATASVNQIN